jgi:hypothetical protein
VQVLSALFVLGGRRRRFVVTATRSADHAGPGAVLPTLLVMCLLLAAMGYGLVSFTAASLNNMAFAFLHLSVLAVVRGRPSSGDAGRPFDPHGTDIRRCSRSWSPEPGVSFAGARLGSRAVSPAVLSYGESHRCNMRSPQFESKRHR